MLSTKDKSRFNHTKARYCVIDTFMFVVLFIYLTETDGDIEPVIPCGGGYKTTIEARCLYDQDKFGHVIGCRSLAHLQNCGKTLENNLILVKMPLIRNQ